MTEEENKAIEYFKDDINYLEEELKGQNFLGRFITIRDKECKMLKILLNLIEKLQKKNHDLNNKVWLYTDKYNDMVISNGKYLDKIIKLEKNSIPKDKIREKLERLESQKENYKEQPLIYMLLKNQLKSLLEEE